MSNLYSGDIKTFVLSITRSDGASPSVTVTPTVMVIQLSTGTTVLAATTMTLIANTQTVYTYAWSTAGMQNGEYAAIVSYASDNVPVNGRLMEAFHLGDSYITGPVALDSRVALDVTVAKDATVAHFADLSSISPDVSATVLAIKAKTDNLPYDPASSTTLLAVQSNVQDLHDYQFGTWTIDKTQNPNVLTILSPAQTVVTRFSLSDSSFTTQRVPR